MKLKKIILKVSLLFLLITIMLSVIKHWSKLVPTGIKEKNKLTIILDAGHGLPDIGASAEDGTTEASLNLQVTTELMKILSSNNINVILTRNNKYSLSKSKSNNKKDDLHKREDLINNSDADIMISIHMNHYNESQYFGAQVFYNKNTNANNKVLADCIQNKLKEIADHTNTRCSKNDSEIYILKKSHIPSVLVECGFLSNESEAMKLKNKKYQQKIALSIYYGIKEYLKISNDM